MAFENKMILLVFVCAPLISFSQYPDYIGKTIYSKNRSVYLLDSVLPFDKAEVLANVDSPDSTLIRTILEKGVADQDYLGFFIQKGYRIKRIKLNDFNKLPRDSVSFTRRERRLLNEYHDLLKQAYSLLSKGEMTTPLDKKLRRHKYFNVMRKEDSEVPMIIGVYAIYKYLNFTLVLYFADIHIHEREISHQIYTSSR
jgi:hypothetical protein